MATNPAHSAAPQQKDLLTQHHFLLRRLHSLSGIVPVGAFLVNHLLTNSTAFLGPEKFDEHVEWIHAMPFLLMIEILFIFAPLAFHAGYGVVIALQGRSNASSYPYMDNWRYTLQRATAWITLVFIIVHLLHFRFGHWFGRMDYKDAVHGVGAFWFTQDGFFVGLPMWVWMALYSVGLVAAVFHFCNGIVTFCISWGITVSDSSRQRVGIGAAGLGLVLLSWGFLSLYALAATERPAEVDAEAVSRLVPTPSQTTDI